MVRMNIVLPEPLARHLKTVPNKSRFIAEAMEEKIARLRSKALRAELAEAYSCLSAEDRKVAAEWSVATEEGWTA